MNPERTRGSCHVRTNKPTTLPTKPTHFLPYSHVYRPHSCISRALTFAYIFFQKNNFTFSRKGSYNQGFLQSGFLTIWGLTFRGSCNQGAYSRGFLQSGVLTTRGSYDQGFLQSGVLQSGVLQSGVLTIRGLNQRVLHNKSVPRC